MDYILNQDYMTGIQLIYKAQERRHEERQWQLYCSIYPFFTDNTFMTFSEFCKKQKPQKKVRKSKKQIVDEVGEMRKKYGWV